MVPAVLSIAGRYSAFKAGAWPSLILNLALGSTYGLRADKRFKPAYQEAGGGNPTMQQPSDS